MKATKATGLNSIQIEGLNRAENFIKALGLSYCIVLPDGTTRGDVEPAPIKGKRRIGPRNDYSHYNLNNVISKMVLGEVVNIRFAEPDGSPITLQSLMSNVSSTGIKFFGRGNFMVATAADNNSIDAMRTA